MQELYKWKSQYSKNTMVVERLKKASITTEEIANDFSKSFSVLRFYSSISEVILNHLVKDRAMFQHVSQVGSEETMMNYGQQKYKELMSAYYHLREEDSIVAKHADMLDFHMMECAYIYCQAMNWDSSPQKCDSLEHS